jgi:hypothetical protein
LGKRDLRLAGHSHNTSRRSKTFEATTTAASTGNIAKRIDAGMTNLSRRVIYAAPQFAVKDDSTAYSRSQGQTNNGAIAAGRTTPHLADRSSICIVFDGRSQP